MDVSLDIAALAGSCLGVASTFLVAMAILLLTLVFRRQVADVVRIAGKRLQKVSVAGFSFEVAAAAELAPRITTADVSADLRKPIPWAEINDSGMQAFTEQLRENEPVDYSIVDLGSGYEWLSSRLYILSIVLARMRGVKAFVFVADRGEVSRSFVGVAAPADVRWALAQRYAWFEPAFASAYASIGDFAVVAGSGKLAQPQDFGDVYPAIALVQSFVGKIQEAQPASAEWVVLPSQQPAVVAEHAQWLTADGLLAILGDRLHRGTLAVENLGAASPESLTCRIVDLTGDYVALTDKRGAFRRLVDRRALVDKLAHEACKAVSADTR